jgi:hypothetical protein
LHAISRHRRSWLELGGGQPALPSNSPAATQPHAQHQQALEQGEEVAQEEEVGEEAVPVHTPGYGDRVVPTPNELIGYRPVDGTCFPRQEPPQELTPSRAKTAGESASERGASRSQQQRVDGELECRFAVVGARVLCRVGFDTKSERLGPLGKGAL